MKRLLLITLAALMLFPTAGQAKAIEAEAVEAACWTQDDLDLLARLIYSEARGEGESGWKLVGQVVLDRLEDGFWGDTLDKVITAKGQFARPAKTIDEPEVFAEIYEVAKAVLDGERYDAGLVILFFQRTKSTKSWYAPYAGHEMNHAYYAYEKEG